MLKKLASSFVAASALVGTMMVPALADDDTFKTICQFPVRVVGSGVGTVLGVPLGAVKDGVKGWNKGMGYTAGKLGNEDSSGPRFFGAVFGGPIGFLGGATYGTFDGSWHGMRTGYSKPFSKDAFMFKDE
ncbi:MAG: hypothetical protein ACRD3W_06215 [Terriglobales bacterium]